MNNLEIFKNEQFGEIRTLQKENGIWFVGKDSAECLGYKNTRDAIIKHVFADDKVVGQVDTPGGKQNMILINESGLYSLG
ncbi:BRO-N domain-containing protein [Clostridium sporogenes]|uniref:BRO-N domain-containing protein n=1 Tax=Clostridium sporogenes TaxID=1509 RepID=UPI00024BA9E0|nr:Bro-N domain-containing protein [Clostridium sporogenes]EHN13115.1 hypothetical protein IYC_20651 [Clostridium sporogenes PA 3679]MDU4597899.1 Bro-N domain-containing protein [Clostridium sporogenes]NFQ35073.1 hypothetical protein [Clostridium sporogenes]NFQ60901.1 hypothetical protein [Clostridium sporogenes]NFU11254.1 hypothetical protein [Clostridium sporogenes]